MIQQMQDTARRLLESGEVKVVIGYAQANPDAPAYPVFVTDPAQVDQLVFNDLCYSNLAAFLTRKEVKALGKPAIVVKGCDEKALVMLLKESQFERGDVYVIGMACSGVGRPTMSKCAICDVPVPRFADETIGSTDKQPAPAEVRFGDLDAFMEKPSQERMAYWQEELSRCVKCYACRQVCPMCYCEQCLVDKNRPQVIRTSATPAGNFAWHMNRAFHLAGRCVGCDECTRACPVGIDLRLLNMSLAKSAAEQFDYSAGNDLETEPLIGSYSEKDKESFIR